MCKAELEDISAFVQISMANFQEPAFEHAIHYMVKSDFNNLREENEKLTMLLNKVTLNTELDEYLRDLLEYGLGKFDAEFVELTEDGNKAFHLWSKYCKEQVQQLLHNNLKDIMKGTRIEDDVVYVYVKEIKQAIIEQIHLD